MTSQLLPVSFKDNKEAHRRLAQAINAALVRSSSTGAVDGLAKTKGNLIAGNGSAWEAVAVGSNGQILTADSSAADGVAWADPLAIGTDVQAWDADLDAIAGLAKTKGNLIAASGSAWEAKPIGSNGQVLTANSAATDGIAWADPQITMVASASVGTGSSITQALTGTVERIEVAFGGISAASAANFRIRLGTGGTLDTTNYDTLIDWSGGSVGFTSGFHFANTAPVNTAVVCGIFTFTHVGGNVWAGAGRTMTGPTGVCFGIGGNVALSGACDIVGIVTTTSTFDAGTWKVSYQRSA